MQNIPAAGSGHRPSPSTYRQCQVVPGWLSPTEALQLSRVFPVEFLSKNFQTTIDKMEGARLPQYYEVVEVGTISIIDIILVFTSNFRNT